MTVQERHAGLTLWTIAAFAALAWALIGLAYASFAPAEQVPRIFQNYHVEHFAAFYIVALLASAALPQMRLTHIGLVLALLAALLASFRLIAVVHKPFDVEDLLCDIAGVFGALAPIIVGRLRIMHGALSE